MFNRKGFTLIEMMITIALLAIVLTITPPVYREIVDLSINRADESEAKLLTKATQIYAAEHNLSLADIFLETSDDTERLQLLYTAGRILQEEPMPQQENSHFSWNQAETKWFVATMDSYQQNFISALSESQIKLEDFLNTNTNFSFQSTKYTPDNWNGYLEKLLEQTNPDLGNTRNPEDEGDNVIGYTNPYHSGDYAGTIFNTTNWNHIATNPNLAAYTPPAILITNANIFDHSQEKLEEKYIPSLQGTMVFYKANGALHETTQVYYINEDGTFSDLKNIEEILPH